MCHGRKSADQETASVSHAASIARSISEGSWTFLVSRNRKTRGNCRQITGAGWRNPACQSQPQTDTTSGAHVLDHRLAGSFMPASVDRRDMRMRACVCARLWWWRVPCEGVWPMSRGTTRESRRSERTRMMQSFSLILQPGRDGLVDRLLD